MIKEDINNVQQEINSRGYNIPAPMIPNSLINSYNTQQNNSSIQSSNNVFDNLVKNQKMSKKML